MNPAVAVSRDRDELTTFISRPPEAPEPVVDATVAVSVVPIESSDSSPEPVLDSSDESTDATTVVQVEPVAQQHDSEIPDTAPVEPAEPDPVSAPPEAEPEPDSPRAPEPEPSRDADATLMLEIPPETHDPPDQDATLFLQVPKRVVGKLIAIKGELEGEQYDLLEGENKIGRSPDSDVELPSMWISRTHAVMRCEMGRVEIESVSDKITSVDGEPVSGVVEVANGAKIQLGGTILRLEFEG